MIALVRSLAQVSLVALAMTACGGSSPSESTSFDAAPLQTVQSDSGDLSIDVRTSPQPPSRGEISVQLVIRDKSSGDPRAGLALSVQPWMPAMGHGASVTPSVSETSPGTYVVSNVDLFMAGTWELRTAISGGMTDHAAPSFEIE